MQITMTKDDLRALWRRAIGRGLKLVYPVLVAWWAFRHPEQLAHLAKQLRYDIEAPFDAYTDSKKRGELRYNAERCKKYVVLLADLPVRL